MQRIGAALWPSLQVYQLYGANTNVGKTIVSTLLCNALLRSHETRVHYIKPVSTGPPDSADERCATPHPSACGWSTWLTMLTVEISKPSFHTCSWCGIPDAISIFKTCQPAHSSARVWRGKCVQDDPDMWPSYTQLFLNRNIVGPERPLNPRANMASSQRKSRAEHRTIRSYR